ncbi:hypothetical protein HZA98_04015 [Candidatus Woesearchaeota archaeon]|nr:hypothetical protein [Candidatus Woesearchaeota archaeon]
MQKRGQFTLFVVLGVVLIVLVALLYVYRDAIFAPLSGTLVLPLEVQEVQDAVQTCVDDAVPTGLQVIGAQGGYFVLPSVGYTVPTGGTVAYGFDAGKKTLPSYAVVLEQYKSYLSTVIPLCVETQDFGALTLQTQALTADVGDSEGLHVEVHYPVTVITASNASYALQDSYSQDISVNFKKVYNAAETIVDALVRDPEHDNYNVYLGTGLQTAIVPVEPDYIIYIVKDPLSMIDGRPFTFRFASYYHPGSVSA